MTLNKAISADVLCVLEKNVYSAAIRYSVLQICPQICPSLIVLFRSFVFLRNFWTAYSSCERGVLISFRVIVDSQASLFCFICFEAMFQGISKCKIVVSS